MVNPIRPLVAPDLEKMTAPELFKMAAVPDQRSNNNKVPNNKGKQTSIYYSSTYVMWGPPVPT